MSLGIHEFKDITCPTCNEVVEIDVYEVDTETNIPTPWGFHIYCNDKNGQPNSCHLYWTNGEIMEMQNDVIEKFKTK